MSKVQLYDRDHFIMFHCQIWKVYDLLANSYRKTGRMNEAMNSVIDGLLADASNLASAAKLWVKIHSDQTNNSADGENSLQSRFGYI